MMEESVNGMYKKELLKNLDKIHTTKMRIKRIEKNLEIDEEPVNYCILKLKKEDSTVNKKGKNYYINADDCIITINSSSYTIITAHKK